MEEKMAAMFSFLHNEIFHFPGCRIGHHFEPDNHSDHFFSDSLTGLYDRHAALTTLRSYVSHRINPFSMILVDVNGLKIINLSKGYAVGDEVLVKVAQVMGKHCRNDDFVARWGDDEFILLLPGLSGEETQSRLANIEQSIHGLFNDSSVTLTFGYASNESCTVTPESLIQEAEKWVFRKKLIHSQSHKHNIIKLLLNILHENSSETREHSDRLAQYCNWISNKLQLSDDISNDIVLLAMLHDIGKIGIRDQILTKPASLTPEELIEIRRHPEIGYRIIQDIPELSHISHYILTHHEWWNGSGYPLGLKEISIPLPSRIISVLDAYDVMISNRVYRKACDKREAIKELKRCSGTQFDPNIVDIFIKYIESDL